VLAHFAGFGPSSLKIDIYAFTKTADRKTYQDVQQDIFLKVLQIIEQNGAALASPLTLRAFDS
jgi:MscS family membrane protein